MNNGLVVQFGSCEDDELVREFQSFVEERFQVQTLWGLGKRPSAEHPFGWTMLNVAGAMAELPALDPSEAESEDEELGPEEGLPSSGGSRWLEEADPVIFIPGEIFVDSSRANRRRRRHWAGEILNWLRQRARLEPELDISLFPMLDPDCERPLRWWTGRRIVRRMQAAYDCWSPQVWVA